MTPQQINKLISNGVFPGFTQKAELIETHISWVVVCRDFVYKIKKPVSYSFLDFSTVQQREYYCNSELQLNRRFSNDIYLSVLPVRESREHISIGEGKGETIDYAVCMRKLDKDKQMDRLLTNHLVTPEDIGRLAEKIAGFHKSAAIISKKDYLDIPALFNDLQEQQVYIAGAIDKPTADLISVATNISATFAETNKNVFAERLRNGFFRDCHGDLHTRNIFLLPAPQPFDCIEFNNDLRQIDILNEVAFLCMDLDAFGRKDLSDLFIDCYNKLLPAISTVTDQKLFIYYKSYRANIRAKINTLRAKTAVNQAVRNQSLAETRKYLLLMDFYIKQVPKTAS